MGNGIVHFAEGISLIASDDTWIDSQAVHQLHSTFELPGMRRLVAMPGLHPGRAYPAGAASFAVGRLYPALVGGDIGAGMALWQTGVDAAAASPERLDRSLGDLDGPPDAAWQDEAARLAAAHGSHAAVLDALGGPGAGNPFAELQQVDGIEDAAAVAALGIDPARLLLLVHGGARGLGETVLHEHMARCGHDGLAEGSTEAAAYLASHAQALGLARANRALLARRVLARLGGGAGQALLDRHHNLVAAAEVDGVRGWLHRRGAAPADQGPVVIPGSRGDYSYLVRPLPAAHSLFSLAHGAGRKWSRGESRERLARRYTPDQLARTRLGSLVICGDHALRYEEAPDAYKPIDSVVHALRDEGLLTILARLRPVLTYRMRGAGQRG
ncbi:RNA ligase RtcB family protein [Cupriavidus sp. USMAHM13]|uniref:RNA ligase RtcB family protein n=1 Tax=Cupriavidus sp. USMAHM13 TaxID=1389192 RepID=UPI0008A68FAD|nr:RNA ligase RtcB family protein [Cupriavidus sp. USMAHM13]AOZ02568.1 RNA ligase RtcB family protein [Cupriavidus sp. USMAHM13]